MSETERYTFIFLLIGDFAAILVSMVAGPLEHTTVATASAISACIISLSLIIYGLYFWKKREH